MKSETIELIHICFPGKEMVSGIKLEADKREQQGKRRIQKFAVFLQDGLVL